MTKESKINQWINQLQLKWDNFSWKVLMANTKTYVLNNKLKVAFWACVSPFLFVALLFIMVYLGVFGHIPTKKELLKIKNPIASSVYASNKSLIGNYFIENRSNVDTTEISKYLRNALVATEDVRFYEHSGVDFKSLGRVIFKTILLRQRSSGGGSTLTQQLVKNVYGRKRYLLLSSAIIKFKEMIIATRLESVYDKTDILTLYLNTVSFGEQLFGIEKVSSKFFNKAPKDLTLAECATLVGLLKAPTYYSPRLYPERSQQRRNVVLNQMVKYGYLDKELAKQTMALPLELDYQEPKINPSFAAYFKEYVKKEFNIWAADNPKDDGTLYDLDKDGLKVYTTLNMSLQKSAERAMKQHMPWLQNVFYQGWADSKKFAKDSDLVKEMVFRSREAKNLKAEGKTEEEIFAHFSVIGPRNIWTWDGFQTQEISKIDSLHHYLTLLHTGILALEPQTGRIAAWVGGVDYLVSQYDNITIPRQVGSIFKPIVYLAGLELGLKPCDYYDNVVKTYEEYEGWTPRNSDRQVGGAYTFLGALAMSVNTVSVEIMLRVGPSNAVNMAKRLGIKSPLKAVPSLVLGTEDISLLEMVNAFATIASGGIHYEPYTILKIENEDGEVIYQRKRKQGERVVAQETAERMQQLLQNVMEIGTASKFGVYGVPARVIGKTGTTQNQSDGWFVASTPQYTIGCWVGNLEPRVHFRNMSTGGGANTSLPIVGKIFADIGKWRNNPLTDFTYTVPRDYCPKYVPVSAAEAPFYVPVDTTAIDSLALDSLGRLLELDTIQ